MRCDAVRCGAVRGRLTQARNERRDGGQRLVGRADCSRRQRGQAAGRRWVASAASSSQQRPAEALGEQALGELECGWHGAVAPGTRRGQAVGQLPLGRRALAAGTRRPQPIRGRDSRPSAVGRQSPHRRHYTKRLRPARAPPAPVGALKNPRTPSASLLHRLVFCHAAVAVVAARPAAAFVVHLSLLASPFITNHSPRAVHSPTSAITHSTLALSLRLSLKLNYSLCYPASQTDPRSSLSRASALLAQLHDQSGSRYRIRPFGRSLYKPDITV